MDEREREKQALENGERMALAGGAPATAYNMRGKRIGRFRISSVALELTSQTDLSSDHAKSLMGLFGQMIIIRATDCSWKASTDYVALSPLFDELGEAETVPWYEIEYQSIDHGEDYAEQGHAHQWESIAKAAKRMPPGETESK